MFVISLLLCVPLERVVWSVFVLFATETIIREKSKILIAVSEAGKNRWPENIVLVFIIFVLKYATGAQYTERV